MKFEFEILIDASPGDVWVAFDNPENKSCWQQNFHSRTDKTGEPGRPGAVTELIFNEKGKRVVLTETITERREEKFLAATYESRRGTILVVNHFVKVDDNRTRWTSWCNFRFNGLMKFVSLFTSGRIRKRTEGDMQRFKLMVETDMADS